jgi:hypothetical protein
MLIGKCIASREQVETVAEKTRLSIVAYFVQRADGFTVFTVP